MATIQKLYNERDLLAQLAVSSESAFEELFNAYSPKVYRTALKFLDSKEGAEEVVQDVFMDIWFRRDKMADVLNFGGYLQGMVRKQVYDAYRKKSAFSDMIKELPVQPHHTNPTEQIIQERDYNKFLRDVLATLPEHQKEIFRLAREEELSHEEIAERLNLSRLAVKSHMKRILRAIRNRLDPLLKAETFSLIIAFLIG